MEHARVHVSHSQFEDTAIAKLVARGIREDIARMFVTEGLRKQNGYDRYKQIVCKAKFHSFFVHDRSKGAMVPSVTHLRTNKFVAPFSMSGREKAELVASFPELDVRTDGRLRNPHAFYANKRLAECELLIMHVWAAAARDTRLNPKSIIDLGGNENQHISRQRAYVHCDTPVLSARDIMRYTLREVYAGVDPSSRCGLDFSSCTIRRDFAIAVHSTYDLTPNQIAVAMHTRGVKNLFGVVNIYPGFASQAAGEFIHDGMVLKVKSDSIVYSFVHDSSLTYTHKKSVLESYVSSQYSIKIPQPDEDVWYTFKHLSVRGSTVVFTVFRDQAQVSNGTSIATGLRFNKYVICIKHLEVPAIEVDMELFDRLVLMASSARNMEDYNITSLFKYAKSLRQRISINSVVLSSGFQQDTQTLVWLTVAAMAVASAYHVEAARYFKQASKEVLWRIEKSIIRELVEIASASVVKIADVIFSITGVGSALSGFHAGLIAQLKAMNSVTVTVGTIKHFGYRFHPDMLGPLALQAGVPDYDQWFAKSLDTFSRVPVDWDYLNYVVIPKCSSFSGTGDPLRDIVVSSYGVLTDYSQDLQVTTLKSQHAMDVPGLYGRDSSGKRYMQQVYAAFMDYLNISQISDKRPMLTPFGDTVVHVLGSSLDGKDQDKFLHSFIAFRGVGDKFVICEPPKFYSSRCLLFVLFYTQDISSLVQVASGGGDVDSLPNPLYSVVKTAANNLRVIGQETGFVYGQGLSVIVPMGLQAGIGPVGARVVYHRNVPADTQAHLEELAGDLGSELSDSEADSVEQGEKGLVVVKTSGGAECSVSFQHRPAVPRLVESLPEEEALGFSVDAGSLGVVSAPSRLEGVVNVGGALDQQSLVDIDQESVGVEVVDDAVSSSGVVQRSGGGATQLSSSALETDVFRQMLQQSQGVVKHTWASDTGSSVGDVSIPGFPAMMELMKWAEETRAVALSVGRRNVGFAVEAISSGLSREQWHGISQGLEGGIVLCIVKGGELVDVYSGEQVSHMAVTNGDVILSKAEAVLRGDGSVWVTYKDLEIWVADPIVDRVSKCVFDQYKCHVKLVRGPAGCGKTTRIVNSFMPEDYGVCETSASAGDTVAKLKKKGGEELSRRFSTVDSFLINKRFDVAPSVLYVDEALRLHAGKIWAMIKVLRPGRVVCYGDPKQIPVLPFTPGFDFKYQDFPFDSEELVVETWRLPADIVMVLCELGYYDYKFKTHNSIVNGIKGVKQFFHGIFKELPDGCTVLTYTKAARDDLRRDGVRPVMTVGESQGKDLDHVWLFRDSAQGKDIYYDVYQTLTAITRVKVSFTYVSATPFDDSGIVSLLQVLNDPVKHSLISSYLF